MPVKISIVTPSFNQAQYLERTLRSVLSQRDNVHEYFVIDGGSTDGSVDIIKTYADHIDYAVSEPDDGQSSAIRRGFTRATGDVLYWLNSDDVLLPNALARVTAAFEATPDVDVISGYGVMIDQDDRVVRLRCKPFDSPSWMRMGYLRVCQPCCFFRRRLYEEAGGIDPQLHCVLDTELWYRMAQRDTRWDGVNAYLAAARLHSETKGATLHDRYRVERAEVKRRYPEFTSTTWRHAAGRFAYYGSQLVSGRAMATWRNRRRWIGRRLDDIFANVYSEPAETHSAKCVLTTTTASPPAICAAGDPLQ